MADSRLAYASASLCSLPFPDLQIQLTSANAQQLLAIFLPLFLSFCGSLSQYEFVGGVLATWLEPAAFELKFGTPANAVIPDDPGPIADAPDQAIWKAQQAHFRGYVANVETSIRVWSAYIYSSLTQGLGDPLFGMVAERDMPMYWPPTELSTPALFRPFLSSSIDLSGIVPLLTCSTAWISTSLYGPPCMLPSVSSIACRCCARRTGGITSEHVSIYIYDCIHSIPVFPLLPVTNLFLVLLRSSALRISSTLK